MNGRRPQGEYARRKSLRCSLLIIALIMMIILGLLGMVSCKDDFRETTSNEFMAIEFFPVDKLIQKSIVGLDDDEYKNELVYSMVNLTNNDSLINGTDSNNSSGIEDNLFWVIVKSIYFNAFGSGVFAGLVTIAITVIIEKFGPQVGGVIGTLPSTIIPATIGFSIEADKNYGTDPELRKHMLIQQFFVIPLAVFCNCLFLVVWKYSPHIIDRIKLLIDKKRGKSKQINIAASHEASVQEMNDAPFEENHDLHDADEGNHRPSVELLTSAQGTENTQVTTDIQPSRKYLVGKMFIVMTLSLLVWFTLAIVIVTVTKVVKLEDYILMILSGVFFGLMVIISVICNWRPSIGKTVPPKKVAWWLILSRGLFTFMVIGVSVILSGLHMTLVSGLLSVFPAIFLTSMVSLWLSQSESAAINAASSMMIGTASLPVFSVVVCVCLWYMNVAFAIMIAFAVSTVIAALVYAFLYWRRRATTPKAETISQIPSATYVENKVESLETSLSV